MGTELVPACGDQPFRHSAELTQWATCNFNVLLLLVVITVLVLFVLACMSIMVTATRHRKT